MDADKNQRSTGIIPENGFITAEELAKCLRLKTVRTLQTQLEKEGIEFANVCGKRLYECRSLQKLFYTD